MNKFYLIKNLKRILGVNKAIPNGMFLCFFLLSSILVNATNYYIAPFGTGNDSNNGTTIGSPKLTLASIFSTYNLNLGDIIYVAAGTYTEKGIVVGTDDEGFTIQGAALSGGVPTTIFDSDQTERWLRMSSDTNDNIYFVNLMIKDYKPSVGSFPSGSGGGISYSNGSNHYDITGIGITNCYFENCDTNNSGSANSGGAIYYNRSSAGSACAINISDCKFYNSNSTSDGGAVYIFSANAITANISNTMFYDNSSGATTAGGYAFYIGASTASTLTLNNCLIHSNSSGSSGTGAIYISSSVTMTAYNNTIYNNTCVACTAAGIYQNGGVVNIYNSILQGNTTKDFYKASGTMTMYNSFYTASSTITGANNVTTAANLTNAAADDYTLLSTSACINAGQTSGAPLDDITNANRIGKPDIGCYEYICTTTYSGTYEVGSGGQWNTLTEAISALNTCMAGSVILELNDSYRTTNETSETYPLNLNRLPTSASSTLTVRPKSTVSSVITLDGSSASTLFDFNETDYVTIDGRPGGIGSASKLSIVNTNTTGNVIKFTNAATYNTIKYCSIQGSSASGSSVLFGTSTIGGNSNNNIDNCTIGRYSTNTVNYAIESTGTASNLNANNTISNSNIADFTTRGIFLNTNSSQWTISKNSIYRDAGITTGTLVGLIYISAGDGYTITGNYLGGNTAYCGGTSGTYFTVATLGSTYGLYLAGSGTNASQINGNFIKYIANSASGVTNVYGFYSTQSTTTNINFYDNEISNIYESNTGTGSQHNVYGCSFNGSALTLNFYRNKIHTLINAASGSQTYYYGCSFAQTTSSILNCYNNFISAGTAGVSSRTYSIRSSSSTAYFLNNTIEMLTNMNNAYDMHCLQIITSSTTNYVYNNIFKSSAISATDYYNACIYYTSGVTVNHNYNYYQNNNLTTACVRTGASSKASFTTWEGGANGKSNTTLTLYSNGVVNANTTDVSGTGTNLYVAGAAGGSSPAITSDIIGKSRPNGPMWMGCYEGAGNVFYSTTSTADASTFANWKTNRDNTGTSPGSFTGIGDIFVVQSLHQYQVTSTNAFTGTSTGYIQVENGGALDINAQTMNGWGSIKLAGTGVSTSGAFYNSSTSAASISVPINLTAATTITSYGSGGLTLTGNISNANYALTIDGVYATTFTGAISGSGDFIKTGAGTLTFNDAGSLTFTNLSITGGKILANKDITVNGVLNLAAANPDATNGVLDMVISYGDYANGAYVSNPSYDINIPQALTSANTALKDNTSTFNNLNSAILTLGASATTNGIGDVTGKIRRTSFVSGQTYTFGNTNTQLKFTSVGGSILPTQITVVATRGGKGFHVDKTNTVKRIYQILRTGGASDTRFTVRFPYEDTELNGNTIEGNLVLWDHHIPYSGITPHEHGKTSNSAVNNCIELSNHGLFYLASEGDVNFTKYWMLSEQVTSVPTWLGAVPGGSWEIPSNWTSGVVPTDLSSIIIPNANTTANDPVLENDITIGTIEIQTDGIFTGDDKIITIKGGPADNGGRGSWNNNGIFNAETSSVVFDYSDATISGTTTFNNVTINNGKKVSILADATATIVGTITNNSSSTIETVSTGTLKVIDCTLNDTFTFTNDGTFEVLGSLTDSRTSKNYGGLVRYTGASGSQSVVGGSYNHLDLTAAAVKLFSSDPTVGGDFTISGGTVTPPALFKFNGTSTQNIAGLPYNNIEFSGNGNKIFTSNGSVSGASEIIFGNGSAVIDFDGVDNDKNFILKSDATGTAQLSNVGNFSLIGNVIVERYLLNDQNKRLWRLLTVPVKGTSNNKIFETWQNNGVINGTTGTDVWGPVSSYSPESNGMYYLPVSTHNFRKYSNGTWYSVTNTKTEELFGSEKNNTFLTFIIKPAGSGVTGNGGTGVTGSLPTTLIAKGSLLSGTQNYTIANTNYHLIGNPYASPIDFENLITTAGTNSNTITEKIWILDPKLGDFGNYVTWDPEAGYSNVNSANHIAGTKIIHSGQGFFVKGKSGATSTNFEIKESDKITSNSYIFGRTASINYERIRVNLDKITNNISTHKDACVAVFYNEASNAVTEKDVQKFSNPAETLSFFNGTTSLSSEHRSPLVDNDVLFIRLTQAVVNSTYKIKINTENFNFSGSAIFHDLKLGTTSTIPLDGLVFEYSFNVTNDATTQGTRFKIVFTTSILGIEDNINALGVMAYPNPTTSTLGVILNAGNLIEGSYNYKIVNILGQEIQNGIFEKTLPNQEVKVRFNQNVSSGWHSISILNKNKIVATIPIIVK